MNNDNLFDLKKVDDLPIQIREDISRFKMSTSEKILALFEYKQILTCEEIQVGIFRMFNVLRRTTGIASSLYNLRNRGLIKAVRKGLWTRVIEPEINDAQNQQDD